MGSWGHTIRGGHGKGRGIGGQCPAHLVRGHMVEPVDGPGVFVQPVVDKVGADKAGTSGDQ